MAEQYFPAPESAGGWRTALTPPEARERAGMDTAALDRVWETASALHGDLSLLVVRHGWLCYERYQGAISTTSTTDLHSCGKAFTGVATSIVVDERADLFPERLDQRVYSERYLPPEHAPVTDERRREIRLGQLLSHTTGLRGNNGATFDASGAVTITPAGPDGGFPEHAAFGHAPWMHRDQQTSTETLWCEPGGGYSYASSGPLIAGSMVRHLTGQEVSAFMGERVFGPIGWEGWGWDDNPAEPDGARHTKAQGGIRPRPRDALRFGYLLRHAGVWDGRRLAPEWYVSALSKASPYNPYEPSYGLQVRVNAGGAAPGAPADAFGPAGFADNYIYVVPSLDLVATRIGHRTVPPVRQRVWETLLEQIVEATRD